MLNVQDLGNKMEELIKELNSRKQDIIVLSETKKKGNGMEIKGPSLHFHSGVPENSSAKRGVSILIKKKFKKNITNQKVTDENMIKFNMTISGNKITILGI